jgi:hypothetical protein
VRFSPKYLIAITPVYYTLVVLGLAALWKESRALFWVCMIALVGISLYSLGDYYVRQHDKLADIHSTMPMIGAMELRQYPNPSLETANRSLDKAFSKILLAYLTRRW